MRHLTPTWSRTHSRVALAFAATLPGTAVAAYQSPIWFAAVAALFFLCTVMLALSFDPMVGGSIGLVAAAGLAFVRELMGLWEASDAMAAGLLETVLFIAAGALAGWAGRDLQRRDAQREESSSRQNGQADRDGRSGNSNDLPQVNLRAMAANGSLGILEAGLGEVRLEEEVERAGLHGRPLAVLWVLADLSEKAGAAGAEVQQRARRATVRTIEATLRPTDVPFAYDERCLVLLLPETDAEGTKGIVARLFQAVDETTFVPETGGKKRIPVPDYV